MRTSLSNACARAQIRSFVGARTRAHTEAKIHSFVRSRAYRSGIRARIRSFAKIRSSRRMRARANLLVRCCTRARIRKLKLRSRAYGSGIRRSLAKSAHNLLTISPSVGKSLPKFQQISKFATMALFDKIKHQICPEFMDNDTVTKAYTIHGNYFKEKGSMGKSSCQKSDLVTFIT